MNHHRTYAGIGARKTPMKIMDHMYHIGETLGQVGWHLRSGGADGADTAFATGCDSVGGVASIIKPQDCLPNWRIHAAKYHPNWSACSEYAKNCHGRNSAIILGRDLMSPVDWIVCWTMGGEAVGGTGQALRVAEDWNIPVYNLWDDPDMKQFYIEAAGK